MKKNFVGVCVFLVAVAVSIAVPNVSLAAAFNVDAGCPDTDLLTPLCDDGITYRTIQAAIDAAGSGDTINVAVGTYVGDLVIPADKTNLELIGAAEAIIKQVATKDISTFPAGLPNIGILASGVKIHGFIIQSPDPIAGKWSTGIVIGAAPLVLGVADVTNIEIYSNTFQVANSDDAENTAFSVGIQTSHKNDVPGLDVSWLNIHDNSFIHLGPGTVGYEGIYINPDTGTGTVNITNNQFTGYLARGITTERSKTTISGNILITDTASTLTTSRGIRLITWAADPSTAPQDAVTITGNTIKGSTTGKGFAQGIVMGTTGQTLTNITVTQNTVQLNATGINVVSSANGVVVNNNNISGNTTKGVSNNGTGTLDAAKNYWGTADRNAVLALKVGAVTVDPYYTDYVGGTLSKIPLTITGITASDKVYDNNTAAAITTSSAALSGVLPGYTDVALVIGGAMGAFNDENVGTDKTVTVTGLSLSGANEGDYILINPTTPANITVRPITVTAQTNSKIYDGTTEATTTVPSITSGGFADGDTATWTQTFDNKNVGTGKTLTPSGTVSDGNGGENYIVTFASNTGTITTRAITVTAAENSKPYDGNTTAAATPTVTVGTLAADDVGAFTENYPTANIGPSKTLIPSGTIADAAHADMTGNYVITFTPISTGAITAKNLTITGAVAQDKVYDGTSTATVNFGGASLSGRIDSEDVSIDSSAYSSTFGSKNAEVGKPVTVLGVALSGDDKGNYTVSQPAGLTATIIKRAITVTAQTNSKIYDGTTEATTTVPSITSGGFADGDTATWTQTFDNKNVGTGKTLTPSGTVSDDNSGANYDVHFVTDTTGVIDKRAITAMADAKSKTYGDANPDLTYTYTNGALQGDDTFSGALSRDAGENVGTYAITKGNLALSDNYILTYVPANLTINKKTISVTADAQTKTYGDSDPGLSYQHDVLVGTDNFSGALARVAGGNVGPYTISQGTLILSDNYTLNFTGNILTITPRAITVTADAKSKTYGDIDPALTYEITSGSLAFSDVFTGSLSRVAGENVGSYNITQETLTAGGNYSVTYIGDELAVAARPITVTAAANSKTYDGNSTAMGTPTITSGTFAAGDTGTFSETYDNRNVGTTHILTPTGTIAAAGPINMTDNYSITFTPISTGVITPRPITVTGAANTKVYDGSTIAGAVPTVTLGSIISDDTGNFTETYHSESVATNKTMDPVGSVTDGNSGNNYAITFANSNNGTITPATLTVSGLSAENKTYNGATDATIFGTGSLVGVAAGDTVILSGTPLGTFSDKNVGTNKNVVVSGLSLTGDHAGNYTLTQPTLTANISQAPLTVSVTAAPKVYDGNTTEPIFTLSVTGIGSDVVSAIGGSASFASANVASGISVTASGYALTGAQSGNYSIANATAATTADITKADSTTLVTCPAFMVYTGLAQTPCTVSITGAGGLNLTPSAVYSDNINVGTAHASYTFADDANHNGSSDSKTFGITKANASITINGYAGTYDGVAHGATLGSAIGALGEDLSGSLILGSSFTNVPGGIAHWTFTGGTNYNDVSGDAAITINKANPTIVVTPYSVTYDGNAHTDVGTAKGVLDEDLSGLDVSGTAHTNAGDYAADAWTFTDETGNYNNANSTVHNAIAKADATIIVSGYTGVYDGSAHGASIAAATGVIGEDLSGSLNLGSSFTNVSGGTAHWTFSNNNYNNQSGDAAITLNARAIEITADNKSKEYGTTDPVLTHHITSGALVGADHFSGTLGRAAGEAVGQYAINQGTVTAGSNYSINFVPGTLTIVDTTPPAIPVINTTAQTVKTDTVHITGTAEADSTVIISGGASIAVGTATGGNYDIAVMLIHNAVNNLSVVAKDASNNISSAATVAITHDDIAPTGTIQINNGAAYARSTAVTLTISATDSSGVSQMKIYNGTNPPDSALWETFATTKSWMILSNDAAHEVSIRFKDNAGNENTSRAAFDSIILDTVAPTATVSYDKTTPTNTDVVATITPSESITVTDAGAALAHTFASNSSFTFHFVDAAGNTGTAVATVSNIDKEAPVITITPNSFVVPTNQDITVTASKNEGSLNVESHLFSVNGSFDFVATDAAGNVTTTTVIINNIDKTAPTIAISGPSLISLYAGQSYVNPGATASDLFAGNLTDAITSNWPSDNIFAASGTTTITYSVSDTAGNATSTTRTVVVSPVSTTQKAMTGTSATVAASAPEVLFSSANTSASTISVPSDVSNATLNMGTLVSGASVTLPSALAIDAVTAVGNVSVQIPSGITVTASTTGGGTWNGVINLPQIKANSTVSPAPSSGTTVSVSSVIEIGYGDTTLTFDKAVRIKIAGQAGKLVGYSRAGAFTKITTTCSADSQAVGDALPTEGECYISVGSDMVIWTKHFTSFATYSETAIPQAVTTPAPSYGGNGAPGGFTLATVVPRLQTIYPDGHIVYAEEQPAAAVTAGAPAVLAPAAQPEGKVLGAVTFKFTRALGLGSRGEDVTALQQRLKDGGVYKGPITGYFGVLTQAGVRAYQIKYKIESVGIVGPKTRAELNKAVGHSY